VSLLFLVGIVTGNIPELITQETEGPGFMLFQQNQGQSIVTGWQGECRTDTPDQDAGGRLPG
jgi:hypothetical protein